MISLFSQLRTSLKQYVRSGSEIEMALLKYFALMKNLPDPNGPLSANTR